MATAYLYGQLAIRRNYAAARAHGYQARYALLYAKVRERWELAEADGLVRMLVEPDDDYRPCECGDPHCRDKELAQRDGAWGLVAEYLPDGADPDDGWETADSCWGFVGFVGNCRIDDYHNEYWMDLARSALEKVGR